MNESERFHRRAVWLIVAIVLASVVGLVGYELNWIHQRRASRAEPLEWAVGSSAWIERPLQFQGPPGRGIGRLDGLIMRLCGEPETKVFFVDDPGIALDLIAKLRASHDPDRAFEDLDQVQHARWLFPEAMIVIECYPPSDTATP